MFYLNSDHVLLNLMHASNLVESKHTWSNQSNSYVLIKHDRKITNRDNKGSTEMSYHRSNFRTWFNPKICPFKGFSQQ